MKSLRSREHRAVCAVLAEARHAAGVTQRQLAAKLRRPNSFIAKIECGERRVDVAEFMQIAKALGVDPADLLRRVSRYHA